MPALGYEAAIARLDQAVLATDAGAETAARPRPQRATRRRKR
jgi:hypothetical protein